jgi:hypothetical protein
MNHKRKGFPTLEELEGNIDEIRPDGWPMPPPKKRGGRGVVPACLKCGSKENLISSFCIPCLHKLGDKHTTQEAAEKLEIEAQKKYERMVKFLLYHIRKWVIECTNIRS